MSSGKRILQSMLDRLFAAIVNGPSLNCRPHSSRQRVDMMQLARLRDLPPQEALARLLSEEAKTKLVGRVPQPPKRVMEADADDLAAEEDKAARRAWSEQSALLTKLRVVAEEARTYENDTGVYVLNVGFPLLSLPPGSLGGRTGTRRVLAPLAFVPVTLAIKSGAAPVVELACREDEIDRVTANQALLAWLERQTGVKQSELFADEEGKAPWREIAEIVRHVCRTVEIPVPPLFASDILPEALPLVAAPKSDETDAQPMIVATAVLGLFPAANQGLLRDTQAMLDSEKVEGTVASFLTGKLNLEAGEPAAASPEQPKPLMTGKRDFTAERLVTAADPSQARAAGLARRSRGLVIHGPPGTGKSQTITNIIADHLARGQRVLFVCDKRTALDVVANRLEHLGLGTLCAVVHDPQRDQRDLYKAIRDQLDRLPDITTHPRAESKLAKIDAELTQLHQELSGYWQSLMAEQPEVGRSFHDLVGEWASIPETAGEEIETLLRSASIKQLAESELDIREVLQRAGAAEYHNNPWVGRTGLSLSEFMAASMDKHRRALAELVSAAAAVDATAHPTIPPFEPADVTGQSAARGEIVANLERMAGSDPKVAAHWARQSAADIERAQQRIRDGAALLENVRRQSLDAEIWLTVRSAPPAPAEIARRIGDLEAYLASSAKWYGFLAFGAKSRAAAVLRPLGLPTDVPSATRARDFFSGLRARLVLQNILDELGGGTGGALSSDDNLLRTFEAHAAVIALLARVHADSRLRSVRPRVTAALSSGDGAAMSALLEGLRSSGPRAAAITRLQTKGREQPLLAASAVEALIETACSGGAIRDVVQGMADRIDTLEGVLRTKEALARVQGPLAAAIARLLQTPMDVERSWAMLRKAVLAAEVTRLLQNDPRLSSVDTQRLQSVFDRYRQLEQSKRETVVDVILHHWINRQKERLLVSTGSRLNPLGADLRRRLTMRGERAMRLRQVVAIGQGIEGGDPLFDICPVWMASPETVAQVLPLMAMFEVVVFDEASQCRLEEALPVLARGQRFVVAGDPKQLPPSRFFESAVAISEEQEIETDTQLFEAQQSEVEDLLTAALSLDIDESYLDVHYRSRNADLISFSNEHFYGSRLQPIPGHPRNRARFAPLNLVRADGVYDKGVNPIEADRVCQIVRDLLKRADPPSIGIACFNINQRDLIAEKLDEIAEQDSTFARRLAEARERRGAASFEGLFVKNLENVQGDERDHIIISTTYGPTADGRFYRRFGPLGRAGGGRRLNVLVTRAREEVHLVTSIPASEYRALPPVPSGQAPTGGWLLFAYLHFAEKLGMLYEAERSHDDQAAATVEPQVQQRESATPSRFAMSLAESLLNQRRIGSDVHWGNDGFCVDVALHHPRRPEQVSIGVLCDTSRFHLAPDPMEWDLFRTAILEGQGWKLHRVWTPHYFRDPAGVTASVVREAEAALADEADPDGLPVTPP